MKNGMSVRRCCLLRRGSLAALLHVCSPARWMQPTDACSEPIAEIAKFYPTYQGALVCMNATGGIGAWRNRAVPLVATSVT